MFEFIWNFIVYGFWACVAAGGLFLIYIFRELRRPIPLGAKSDVNIKNGVCFNVPESIYLDADRHVCFIGESDEYSIDELASYVEKEDSKTSKKITDKTKYVALVGDTSKKTDSLRVKEALRKRAEGMNIEIIALDTFLSYVKR